MSRNVVIEDFEKPYIKKMPEFNRGDTIKVYSKIIEGQKERIQGLTGVVIAKKGKGASASFTIYRNAYGSYMERVFLLNSPQIAKIEVIRFGDVRKSKLYYIKGKSGKKAKIKEKIFNKKKESV